MINNLIDQVANHFKYSSINKRIVKVLIMKLYIVLMMMEIEYIVKIVINSVLKDITKII